MLKLFNVNKVVTYESRNKSAKELRLICSPFIATCVKIIWSGCTPCAAASEHTRPTWLSNLAYTPKKIKIKRKNNRRVKKSRHNPIEAPFK